MFFCLEKGRLFLVLLRSMLQSVSADSQIDYKARIAFWLRTSIYFCLSLSHRLFLFLLLSPHAFLFPSIFSFFYQTLFQSTSLIFPSPSCKSPDVWRNAWAWDVGNALNTVLQMGCKWRIDQAQKLIKSFQETVPWIRQPGHQSTAHPSLLWQMSPSHPFGGRRCSLTLLDVS